MTKLSDTIYDLVIIGAGPIGLATAIEAKKANLNYIVLEKGVLVNALYNFPEQMTFFSTSKLLEIGGVPFISHIDKPTRKEALEYYRRVQESWQLSIKLYTTVQGMKPLSDGGYELITDKGNAFAKAVTVCTGFYDTPRKLGVPGETLDKVKHFYDSPHPYVGQKIIVVGAANSACDVALETYHKGAEVTMVVRKSEISPRVKYWIRPNIVNRIKDGVINAFFDTQIIEIKPEEVVLQTPKGKVTIENDFVLAMVGYTPDYGLFENLGLPIEDDEYKRPVYNEETLESGLPNVYVAGVINAGLQTSKFFIENTRQHGKIIVDNIKAKL